MPPLTFEDIRSKIYGLLGDIQDWARSDRAPGTGPTGEQADALTEAVRYVGLAKDALNRAAKRG